jgi:hypothetical protein
MTSTKRVSIALLAPKTGSLFNTIDRCGYRRDQAFIIKIESEPNRDPSPQLTSIAVSGTSSGTGGVNLGSQSGVKWRAYSQA